MALTLIFNIRFFLNQPLNQGLHKRYWPAFSAVWRVIVWRVKISKPICPIFKHFTAQVLLVSFLSTHGADL